MKIRDLSVGSSRVSVEGKVLNVGEPRRVKLKTGEDALVADATLDDGTATIVLSLWNEQIGMVKEGDTVKVINGYVSSFRSEKRLNVGRYGKLIVNGATRGP